MGLLNTEPVYDAGKLQTLVNAAKVAGDIFHASANVATGTLCFLGEVTGAQIGVSGQYSPATQQTVRSTATPAAGQGAGVLPWTAASVFSLRTAVPRGRGSNGRVYWPMTAGAITSTTGRLGAIQQQARATAFKNLLDSLNTAGNAYSPGMRVVVASNVGGGTYAFVTSVRNDDRLDGIERRENDQPVQWWSATLT